MPAYGCPKCRTPLPAGEPGAIVACAVCDVAIRLPGPAPVALLVDRNLVGGPLAPAAVPVAPLAAPLPPIVYSCPTCQARLQAEAGDAGTTGPCPHCGQRLLIPRPRLAPVNRTVLGTLEPAPLLPLPAGRASVPAVPATTPPPAKWAEGPSVRAAGRRVPRPPPFPPRKAPARDQRAWAAWQQALLGGGCVLVCSLLVLLLWVIAKPDKRWTEDSLKEAVVGRSTDDVIRLLGSPDEIQPPANFFPGELDAGPQRTADMWVYSRVPARDDKFATVYMSVDRGRVTYVEWHGPP